MDQKSQLNVPQWFEEISDNVQRHRPASWTVSDTSLHKTSKSSRLPKSAEQPETSSKLSLFDNFETSNSDCEQNGSRNVLARHGRRSLSGSYSAGNSPGESGDDCIEQLQNNFDEKITLPAIFSEPSLEESWSSLSFFERRHKGMLSDLTKGVPDDQSGLEKKISPKVLSKKDFIIPELPGGCQMVINIKSTWGDRHYLGLNGIEIFSKNGEPAAIEKIWADPADINILPEYGKDPRVVSNLLDGVNRTHDDMHLWLTPFTPGSDHFIYICFKLYTQVAMVRIWNYNKSRIHSFRGAKDVEITLDGMLIFQGEIAKASGGIQSGTESFGDTILFTTDESILECISQYDNAFSCLTCHIEQEATPQVIERPLTADVGEERPFTCARQLLQSSVNDDEVMTTCVTGSNIQINLLENWGHPALIGLTGFEIVDGNSEIISINPCDLSCSVPSPDVYRLVDGINVTTDDNHMWNTGFLSGKTVTLSISFPDAKDITAIQLWNYNASPDLAYCGVKLISIHVDEKLLEIGFDGIIPVRRAPGNCHFNFVQEINLCDKSVNKSENSFENIKAVNMDIEKEMFVTAETEKTDDCIGWSVGSDESKEEENLEFNLSDECPLITEESHNPCKHNIGNINILKPPPLLISTRHNCDIISVDEEYEAPVMPKGFVFQMLILSTWGDMYYVGLNGIELYNESGNKIRLTENNIGAYPDSVNVLEGIEGDVRTPDKLVDGVNDTLDGRHMWLAPILPNELNRVYIVFDYPVTVSMIKLWNYAKTPSRGVKEFGILVDDLLVYNGELDQAPPTTKASRIPYHTVLFTSDTTLINQEQSTEIRHKNCNHRVRLLNDHKRVTSGGSSCYSADPSLRPHTSIVHRNIQNL